MKLTLRTAEPADAAALGDICYRAFESLAQSHGFAPDFPNAQVAAGVMSALISHAGFFNVVAEADGVVVGSNFLDERGPIGAVGPITIDPAVQNAGAGRALMDAVMQRAQQRNVVGLRLVQAGYHCRSLALYLKLGFTAREHLSCVRGEPVTQMFAGREVRAASSADLDACNDLCLRVHGHARPGELADAVATGSARLVEQSGCVTGYCTVLGFSGHAVGESNDDLKALISAGSAFQGAGLLVPTRNSELMRWCLDQNLRITQTLTLMTIGLYNEPSGAWLPSVLY